jgi:para-nitrobenzyl esterase
MQWERIGRTSRSMEIPTAKECRNGRFSDANPKVMYFRPDSACRARAKCGSLKVLDSYFAWRRTPEGEAGAK